MAIKGRKRRRRGGPRGRITVRIATEQPYRGRIFLNPDPSSNQVFINIGLSSKRNMCFPEYNPNILSDAISEQDYNTLAEDLVSYINENGIGDNKLLLCAQLFCTCGIGALLLSNKANQLERDIKSKILASSWTVAALPSLVTLAATSIIPAYDTLGNMCKNSHGRPVWPPMGYNIVLDFLPQHTIRQKWPQPFSMLLAMSTLQQTLTSLPVNLSSQAQQFLQYQQMQMQIIQQQNPRLSAKFQRHKELPVAQDASIPVVMAQPVMDVAVAGTYNHEDKEPIDEDEEEEEEEEEDDAPPSMIDQMHALNDLKAQGIITEEHFEAARKMLASNYQTS